MQPDPRKQDVLIDIDGCFANFIDASLPHLRRVVCQHRAFDQLPSNLATAAHEDVASYRMEELFGLTSDEIATWHGLVKQPGYCAAIQPYPYARECIARLQRIANVYPVTFPWPKAPHWIIERETWLEEQLGIDPDGVIYTRQKHMVVGDIFVEDTTKYLVAWKKRHRDGVAIRVRRPYNKHEPFDHGVTVDTLEQLADEIEHAIELREAHRRSLWDR